MNAGPIIQNNHRAAAFAQHCELLSRVLEGATSFIYAVDKDLRIRYASPAAVRAMGTTTEEIVGRSFEEVGLNPQTYAGHRSIIQAAFDRGEPTEGEASNQTSAGTYHYVYQVVPLRNEDDEIDLAIITAFNVTRQKDAIALNQALNKIHGAISSTLNFDEIMRRVIAEAGETLRADAAAIALREDEGWVLKYVHGLVPERAIGTTMSDAEMRKCFLAREECFSGVWDVTKADWVSQDMLQRYQIMSFLSLPLKIKGEIEGVLLLANLRPYQLSDVEMDFANKLASSLSLALENSRIYREERRERFLLQTILDNVPAVVIAMEGESLRIIWANAASEMFKLGRFKGVDTTGLSLQDIIPTAEESGLAELFRSVARSGQVYHDQEFALAGLGPGVIFWRGALVPMKNPQREVPDLLILAVDVTTMVSARKKAEEMARKAEGERLRLRAILDTLPVGVTIADQSGQVVENNEVARALWGMFLPAFRDIHDLEGVKAWHASTGQLVGPGDWGLVRALFGGARTTSEVINVQRFDGRMVTLLLTASPLVSPQGYPAGAVNIIQDITHQVLLESEVTDAKKRADLYMDLLTHDINNLNAAAIGYLQLVEEQARLEARTKSWTERSLEALHESSRLIENIRSIQRIEVGEQAFVPVDLDEVLSHLVETYQFHPSRDIAINLSSSGRHCILATEVYREVFANLIDNSIRHSSGDLRINIRVSTTYEEGRQYHRVEIEDNGPGVPDRFKDSIFSRTWRGRTKAVGKGLGLFLVKRLVEDAHGMVWVEDRVPGDHTNGAKFIVQLPAAPCE